MKVSYSKKNHKFFLSMLAIAASCCLITSASYSSGVSSFAASALGVVVTPVQKLMDNVHGFIKDKTEYFQSVDMLLDENAQLKSTIIDLNRKVSELTPAQKENEMLYNFLELKKERNDIKFVNADIISRVSSNYTSEITLDKGSIHGIKKDMAIVTEDNSLLGIIVEVGATYSRGKTLTSYDFSVGIENERTGLPGILSGNFELSRKGLCCVIDLYDTDDYKAGDIIRTSGLGDIYPAGIYVGTVTEIIPDKLNYTVNACVKPATSVFDTDMVMVITGFDRAYELTSEQSAE